MREMEATEFALTAFKVLEKLLREKKIKKPHLQKGFKVASYIYKNKPRVWPEILFEDPEISFYWNVDGVEVTYSVGRMSDVKPATLKRDLLPFLVSLELKE